MSAAAASAGASTLPPSDLAVASAAKVSFLIPSLPVPTTVLPDPNAAPPQPFWTCPCGHNYSLLKSRCGKCSKWKDGKRTPTRAQIALTDKQKAKQYTKKLAAMKSRNPFLQVSSDAEMLNLVNDIEGEESLATFDGDGSIIGMQISRSGESGTMYISTPKFNTDFADV